MKDALHYLFTNEIHTPNSDHDIDIGSDGLTATDQDIPAGP